MWARCGNGFGGLAYFCGMATLQVGRCAAKAVLVGVPIWAKVVGKGALVLVGSPEPLQKSVRL